MIDKQNFYHGAALLGIIEHTNCKGVRKFENGILVNENTYVFLKYTTKQRSPWNFTFSDWEIERLNETRQKVQSAFIVFICGGDGICVITFDELSELIEREGRWISVRRKFRERYTVSGPGGDLKYKVSFQRWPQIIFQ